MANILPRELVNYSLRFNGSNQYLSRTPSVVGNQQKLTFSCWLKKTSIGTPSFLFSTGTATDGFFIALNNGTDGIDVSNNIASSNGLRKTTTALFRDPTSWYHLVVSIDTTNSTVADRVRIEVNGIRVISFSTSIDPTLNYNVNVNNTIAHAIGYYIGGANNYLNGYLTEVVLVDGQALDSTYFGYKDLQTNKWLPKQYRGTFGINGFYLPFTSGTNTTTLGYDLSGNTNNWTLNNFTRVAGVNECWMMDCPINNFSTINPLVYRHSVGQITYSNGGLSLTNPNNSSGCSVSNFFVSSGQWSWEVICTAIGAGSMQVGVDSGLIQWGLFTDSIFYSSTGNIAINGSNAFTAPTYTTNDIIGVALDKNVNIISFYKNNILVGAYPLPTNVSVSPSVSPGITNGTASINFGQRSFTYTPPTGFKPLCQVNLPKTGLRHPERWMDVVTYTGNGKNQDIACNVEFPDFVWIKNRTTGSTSHVLVDSVRGFGHGLSSDSTAVEDSAGWITSNSASGFTISNTSHSWINATGNNYVAWVWKAGGPTVTNTAGSITSQVSVNKEAGFSIVSYTGTGVNATVGHGLGVAPKMIIAKDRQGAYSWGVYHTGLTSAMYYTILSGVQAQISDVTVWNGTPPTSTVFSIGTSGQENTNGHTNIVYCFSEIEGFSKFGNYVGNGSTDGPFVYCGFRPKFIMIKRIDNTSDWGITDSIRTTLNVMATELYSNLSVLENTSTPGNYDLLSNGFKLRGIQYNASSGSYIFAAFAETPPYASLAR